MNTTKGGFLIPEGGDTSNKVVSCLGEGIIKPRGNYEKNVENVFIVLALISNGAIDVKLVFE